MLILTHPAVVKATATTTATITTTTTTTLNNTIYRTNTKLISRFRIACINAASSLSQMQRLISLLLIICYCADLPTHCVAIGYSYSRFVGPVSGPEHKVLVYDALSGGSRVDFMAKPEYEFAYGVEDGTTRVLQNRKESREGDAVKGVYSVVDPDGTLRVVKYTADDVNGFQAEIITNGVSTIHGHGEDNHQNAAAAAAAATHDANGKNTAAANWQMVHTLQPPRLHEVQHVVGNRNEVGVQGGPNDAAGEDDATTVNQGANSKQQKPVTAYNEEDYADDDADGDEGNGNEGSNKQAESAEDDDDRINDDDDDDYEDAAKDAQSYEEDSDEYY